jgi:SAM-dependent methyltransferase
MRSSQAHWQQVYEERDPVTVSWYQGSPARSLELIEHGNPPPQAAILDAGGGASTLAPELVRRGYRDVTVADISAAALDRARGPLAALGKTPAHVEFLVADLREHRFARRYDLWHDRAVFHFMVAEADRDAYLATLRRTLKPDGQLILATFGPEGPTSCSGLPVNRYGSAQLAAILGPEFKLVEFQLEDHTTPSAAIQQFLWTRWRRGTQT